MAKYCIAFVLLALLAMENNSIYNRIHARSQYSAEAKTIAHYMRPQQHNHLHQAQLPYHIHKRSQELHAEPPGWRSNNNSDEDAASSAEGDAAAALQHYIHLQRHMEHQAERQRHQQEIYHHAAPSLPNIQRGTVADVSTADDVSTANDVSSVEEFANLRKMPRVWQHLLGINDRMYGDSPWTKESEPQQLQHVELPVDVALDGSNSLESNENLSAGHVHGDKTMRCPKCESNRQVEHISEEELTQLRIEFVKQQILEKLRLKERPNVSAIGLPKPIYEGTTIEEEDEKSKNKDLDDYYARTKKKFIFLKREERECQRLSVHPSICFSFKIDDADADGFDVSTAVLWIFKNKQRQQRNNTILKQQTIVVSEVHQQLDTKYLPIVKTIAIQSVDVQDEWMKIDIEWPIKRWFGNHDLSHLIHISCQSCDISSMDEMISVDKDYQPFIMVDTQNRRRVSRRKRGINCTDGVTECCREKLYISFDEIGWGDWIIQPRGYDAYFCRGSCGSVASVAQSATHHSTFLQKVVSAHRGGGGSKPLELIPCCTAKQYSSLQLVFMDSNNTATQKTFPNMVVESCGCR